MPGKPSLIPIPAFALLGHPDHWDGRFSTCTIDRVTRSGKEGSGLSKAQTANALEDYRAVVLENFDVSSLLQPVHLYNLNNVDEDKDEPILRQYSLRSRSLPNRSYSITPLSKLATFRPKKNSAIPSQGQELYDGTNRRSRRLQKKRDQDRAKRAKQRFAAQVRLGCAIKSHQLARVRETESKAVTVHFDLNRSIADVPTWTGMQDSEEGGPVSLDEAKRMPGFQVFPNDGR
ncbi:hypothetical protein F5878DRAFT_648066, partial [Lentinula raphanica]